MLLAIPELLIENCPRMSDLLEANSKKSATTEVPRSCKSIGAWQG